MTDQDRMNALLGKAGIPAKEIKVLGSQIMVTAWSRDAAEKWVALLTTFAAKVHPIVESRDYNVVNRNTMLRPTRHPVWLVGAVV